MFQRKQKTDQTPTPEIFGISSIKIFSSFCFVTTMSESGVHILFLLFSKLISQSNSRDCVDPTKIGTDTSEALWVASRATLSGTE